MKILGKVIFGTIRTLVTMVMIIGIGIFGMLLYMNIEESKNNWRNYGIEFSEDSISVGYQVPVAEVLEDTIMDSLELISTALEEL